MKNREKSYVICMIAVLIMLFANMTIAIYDYVDYQKRIKSGNERWKQVEKRIEKIEDQLWKK